MSYRGGGSGKKLSRCERSVFVVNDLMWTYRDCANLANLWMSDTNTTFLLPRTNIYGNALSVRVNIILYFND
jgi:hypothetical protein